MRALTLEDALRAWASRDAGVSDEERDGRMRIQVRLLRALAEGRPLTPEAFANATGVPLDQVPGVFARLEETGLEFDGDGNLVGAALTLGCGGLGYAPESDED